MGKEIKSPWGLKSSKNISVPPSFNGSPFHFTGMKLFYLWETSQSNLLVPGTQVNDLCRVTRHKIFVKYHFFRSAATNGTIYALNCTQGS